jgi:DNA-binding MarR family transcriptional regulator
MANRKPDHSPAAVDHGALKQSLGYLVHLADLANMQGFARAFAGTGLTAARYTALELIGSNPGIKPADLAAAMAVERSNLVALVRFLSDRGWARAGAGPNRREKSLELTPAGHDALAGLRERLARHERELAARLSTEDRRQLEALLARIVGA